VVVDVRTVISPSGTPDRPLGRHYYREAPQ